MRATDLLTELEGLGVVLAADGDRLRYDAPKGVLTPELRQQMAELKAELLGLVEGPGRARPADMVAIAELLVAGPRLEWPELQIAPHLTILAGEGNWLRFLENPPPGTLPAALEAAKRRVEAT